MATTLTQLRDGLHFSVSQAKSYLRCPRQYQLRYVLGAAPEFVPANLVLGSAVHEGLAAYYRAVMTTAESPEFDVCLAAFRATLAGFRRNTLPIKDGDDIEAQGEALLKVFYETVYQDPPNVVGVEVPFKVDLADPVTGEVLEEALVGGLDLVLEQDKKNIVVEHKTAGRKWSEDQIKHDIQLAAYKLVARALGLGEAGLRLQILLKTKSPKMVVEETSRTERDEQEFLETVVGVLRAIDAQAFFPIRTSMCGGCPFQRRCESR
jgi:putative RecB family exonuclease